MKPSTTKTSTPDKLLNKATNAIELFVNFIYRVITTPIYMTIDIAKTLFKSPSIILLAVANLVSRTILNVLNSTFKIVSSILNSYNKALPNLIRHIQELVLNLCNLKFDRFLSLLINTPKLLIKNLITEPLSKLTTEVKGLVTDQYNIVKQSLDIAAGKTTAKLPNLHNLEFTFKKLSHTIASLFEFVISGVNLVVGASFNIVGSILMLPKAIVESTFQLFDIGYKIVTNAFRSPSAPALAVTAAVTRTVLNVVTFVFDVPLSIVANTYKALKNTITHAGNLVSNLLELKLNPFLENVVDAPKLLINNIFVNPLVGLINNIRNFVSFQYNTAEASIRIAAGERSNQYIDSDSDISEASHIASNKRPNKGIIPTLIGYNSAFYDCEEYRMIPTSTITSVFYEKGFQGAKAAISATFK